MRVTPVLTIVVIVLAALAGTALATALALLWPDRYVTRPGWPTYYLGISALVRDAPVAGAAAPPLYAGSLGTTRVAAQSELTMLLAPGQSEAAWQAQQDYLRALGFVPMRTPAAEPASPAWRNAAFLAPRGGGIVLLTLDPVGDGGVGAQLNLLHLR